MAAKNAGIRQLVTAQPQSVALTKNVHRHMTPDAGQSPGPTGKINVVSGKGNIGSNETGNA